MTAGTPAGTATVLVVDDEPDVRLMLSMALRVGGFTVVEAASAADGRAALDTGMPDAAVLDVHLPDQLGWDVLADIRARGWDDLPVVLLTADVSQGAPGGLAGDRRAVLRHKPLDPACLVDELWRRIDE